MANRVTPAEVAPLVPGIAEASLPPFIATANLVVNESLVDKGMSEDRLKLIEQYLSGHYATVSYGEKTMEKVGDATNSYAKATAGAGILETALGRQAAMFDTSGTLQDMGGTRSSFDLVT